MNEKIVTLIDNVNKKEVSDIFDKEMKKSK